MPLLLRIESIRMDDRFQSRVAIDQEVVEEYIEHYRGKPDGMPAIEVVEVAPGDYLLVDGWHRVLAAERAGLVEILANVTPGTERDALLRALCANQDHGLRRSNADKRRAVLSLLADEEWGKWSSRQIAKAVGVSHTTVERFRDDSSGQTLANVTPPQRGTSQLVGEHSETGDTETPQKQPATTGDAPESFDQNNGPVITGERLKPADAHDSRGRPLPKELVAAFAQRDQHSLLAGQVAELLGRAKALAKLPGGCWVDAVAIQRTAQEFRYEIANSAPYAVCDDCQGRAIDTCGHCRGSGFLPEHIFKLAGRRSKKKVPA